MKIPVLIILFWSLSVGFLKAQLLDTMIVYDVRSHQVDTILPVSYNDTITFDHTGFSVGTLGNQIPLSLIPPTTNLFSGSNFSKLARAATFFDVTDYPVRTAVELKYWYPSGFYDCGCSGIMVAHDFVLTAAHCVYWYNWNGDSILIAPASDNGMNQPGLPVSVADKYYLFKSYINGHYHDIALLHLSEPIGLETGWVGIAFATNDSYFQNKVFHKLSYPATYNIDSSIYYNGDTLYYNYGYLSGINSSSLGVNSPEANGVKGQSGSSIFYTDNYEYYSFGVYILSLNYTHFRIQNRYFYQLKNIIDNYSNGIESNAYASDGNFAVYPNPAHVGITVEKPLLTKESHLYIYSINGQLLFDQQMTQSKSEINISHFANGVYIIRVISDEISVVSKFVKD